MTPVFLDTWALQALVNSRDSHHAEAVRLCDELAAATTTLFCSDWVLAEFLASCARPPLRGVAVKMVRSLRASPHCVVVPADRATWDRAFQLYDERRDKHWSLVDCATMVLCQDRGIRRVFSHDQHFAQAGFELMIP